VTSDDSKTFDSGSVAPRGGTFSFTTNTPGTFAYHCTFHPWMKATLVVTAVAQQPAPTATPLPRPTATPVPTPSAGGAAPVPPTPTASVAPAVQVAPTPTVLPRTGGAPTSAGVLLGLGLTTIGGWLLLRARR
jgi:LPXTG-motif cell wall-anchored protein